MTQGSTKDVAIVARLLRWQSARKMVDRSVGGVTAGKGTETSRSMKTVRTVKDAELSQSVCLMGCLYATRVRGVTRLCTRSVQSVKESGTSNKEQQMENRYATVAGIDFPGLSAVHVAGIG